MFGIKLKLDSRRIWSWLFFDPICIMGEAKPRQSGGTAGKISLMSSLPVDETARAHENRRHCSRPYFAPYLPGVQYPLSLSIGAFTGPFSVITTYFQRFDQAFVFYVSLNLVSILSLAVWILIGDDSYENVHVILLKQTVLKMCIERVSLNHCTYFVDCLKRQN